MTFADLVFVLYSKVEIYQVDIFARMKLHPKAS